MNANSMPVRRLTCTIPTKTFEMLEKLMELEDRKQGNLIKQLIEQEYKKVKKG